MCDTLQWRLKLTTATSQGWTAVHGGMLYVTALGASFHNLDVVWGGVCLHKSLKTTFRSVICRSHSLQQAGAIQTAHPIPSPTAVPERQDPAILYSNPAILHLQACASPQASQAVQAPQVRPFAP